MAYRKGASAGERLCLSADAALRIGTTTLAAALPAPALVGGPQHCGPDPGRLRIPPHDQGVLPDPAEVPVRVPPATRRRLLILLARLPSCVFHGLVLRPRLPAT